jgi:hypothetical protein
MLYDRKMSKSKSKSLTSLTSSGINDRQTPRTTPRLVIVNKTKTANIAPAAKLTNLKIQITFREKKQSCLLSYFAVSTIL